MSDFFATPWTVVCQAPLSMGFPRQEYWSGLPFPSQEDLPDPGIPALASGFFTPEPPGKSSERTASTKQMQCDIAALRDVHRLRSGCSGGGGGCKWQRK